MTEIAIEMANKKYDIESVMKRLAPDLSKLIEGQNVSWSSINKQLGKVLEQREIDFKKNGGYLRVQSNFYDIIVGVIEEDAACVTFFIFINIVLKSLNANLTKEGKIMVAKIVRNVLRDFTLDFIHSLGELFVLSHLLVSKNYKLVGVEHRMENGKRIDFKIFNTDDNKELLIEVMNIWIDEDKVKTEREIEEFLLKKFLFKILDKNKSAPLKVNFFLMPVLWGTDKGLRKVSDFYQKGGLQFLTGVMEPCSYCSWHDEQGEVRFKFAPISSLFE